MAPMDKPQFKLKPKPELFERLIEAAEAYGRPSANMLALEIVEKYFPFWLDLEAAREREFELQRERAGIGQTPTDSTRVLRLENRVKQRKLGPKSARLKSKSAS